MTSVVGRGVFKAFIISTQYTHRVQCYHHHLQGIQDAAGSFLHEVSDQAFTSKTKKH